MGIDTSKPIKFSAHSLEKMADRGVSKNEVESAIRSGNPEPTRKGRFLFRKNFTYNQLWRGSHYSIKQVAAVVAEEAEYLVVVTVYAFYFKISAKE